jgi:chromosome segregation ATPase
MAQSLEKRMTDVEYIIAHLPDDLNAPFAGVDVKFAAIRETQLLHTQRFSTIERKIDLLGGRVDALEARMDRLESRMDGLESRMGRLDTKIDLIRDALEAKIDLVLQRLPSQ